MADFIFRGLCGAQEESRPDVAMRYRNRLFNAVIRFANFGDYSP